MGPSGHVAASTILRGWARAEQGQREEGSAQIRQGLRVYQATGAQILLPYYLGLLAEVQGKEGQTEEGLSVLTEALAQVDASGERWHEAELYRLRGELLREQEGKRQRAKILSPQPLTPSTQDAEACFLKATEIARRQQAKSLELRAATSLARLWQQQGKQKEAHHLLSEIYGWFTEGFDTKDLQEAKALLEELA